MGLLGPLEVRSTTGALIQVGGARARTLLALLAIGTGHAVTSTWLIDRIWGRQPPDGASNALQALVSRLRRRMPDGAVQSHPSGYRLAINPDSVDIHRFQRLASAGAAALAHDPDQAAAVLADALALWRGPALAGVADLTGAGRSAAGFLRAEAARLDELRWRATEDLTQAQLAVGTAGRRLPELETLVASQPTRERAAALLVQGLAADGRGADALAAYERTRAALAQRLGADPSPDLADLHRRLLRGDPELFPRGRLGTGTTLGTGSGARTNLPAPLTSFVGRDNDLVRVGKLIGESRLTTLTGPGGSGKTRLALEAARAAQNELPGGAWLVELAPLSEPAHTPYAVLGAIGLGDPLGMPSGRGPGATGDAGTDVAGRLVQALAGKARLLVLDNCEHLVEEVAVLAELLLRSCPQLRILATSREPLGIAGEALWPVGPLALPPVDADACQTGQAAAVRLLLDRAAAVQPGLAADDTTATDLARICRALDGMPLAIELAAARLRTMTPPQLAARLDERLLPSQPVPATGRAGTGPDERFRVLTGGSRTALPRHQTLRAVVDWSWDLLTAAEQALLRRLAYFTGGVTLAAAERVCGHGEVAANQVLDLLTSLVDKSLLLPVLAGEHPRYRMLETIRAYGLERLADAEETELVRLAHAAYFVDLAETAEPQLRTGQQRQWLDRLGADHENLQLALRGAVAAGEADSALRLVAALGWYWSLAGHRRESLPLAIQALGLPGTVPDATRAQAYTAVACAAMEVVPEEDIERWFRAAADLAARDDQSHPMLRLVGPLSALFDAWRWGSPAPAALELDRLLDDPDPWVRGTARNMRAHVILNTAGYRPEVAQDVAAALAAYRESGDDWGVAFGLENAAELAVFAGDLDTAIGHLTEAVTRLSRLGIPEDMVLFQARLAELRWSEGDRPGAEAVLAAAALGAERIGAPALVAMVARVGADLARLAGDLATARSELAQALVAHRLPPEQQAARACAQAHLAVAEGDLAAAGVHSATALELAIESGCGPLVARALLASADAALAGHDPDRAAQLLGAGDGVRGAGDPSRPDAARLAAAAQAALGAAGFADAYARGRLVSSTVDAVRDLAGDPRAHAGR